MTLRIILLIVVTLSLVSSQGLVEKLSDYDVDTTIERLRTFITENTPISIIGQIDHSANAASVGLSLPPSKVLIIGNANIGTVFMRADQRYGIEAPIRILVWDDGNGQVHVTYNDAEHNRQRFCISDLDATFMMTRNALNGITNAATGRDDTVEPLPPLGACDPEDLDAAGLVVVKSENSVSVTVHQLVESFENTPIRVVLNFDHQANAFNSGLELRPTTVVWFGNPALGTPVMNSNNRAGNDLPQKVIVWEAENGDVYLAYNNPNYIRDRYQIDDQDHIFTTFGNALSTFTGIAATEASPSVCVTPLFDLENEICRCYTVFCTRQGRDFVCPGRLPFCSFLYSSQGRTITARERHQYCTCSF